MINFDFKNQCYGCAACKNICPKGAIKMVYNDEGFLVPEIDKVKCVNCGLCSKVCPRLNFESKKNDISKIKCMYIYKKNIDDDLKLSTSSGVAFELSKCVINSGGYVCGCIWENMIAKHIITNNIKDLKKIRGSKYVQSDIQSIYKDIRKIANDGKEIVFFGTGCQIKGIRSFLRKDFPNICYIQIICHSVASPKVFEKYIGNIEKKYKKKLVDINFRHKGKGGWLTPNSKYSFNDHTDVELISDPYFVGFGKGLFDRRSCSSCQMKNDFNLADVIIGDAWGMDSTNFKKSKNYGASSIVLNTLKGERLFQKVSNEYNICIVSLSQMAQENPALIKSCAISKDREKIINKILNEDYFPSSEILGAKHKLKFILAKTGVLSSIKKIEYIWKHR